MTENYDRWGRNGADISGSPRNGFNITPSDTLNLPKVTRGVWVGEGGDLVVDFVGYDDDPGEEDVTFVVGSGRYIYGQFAKIKEASTATNLVGLY